MRFEVSRESGFAMGGQVGLQSMSFRGLGLYWVWGQAHSPTGTLARGRHRFA